MGKIIRIGDGELCPKCDRQMERRSHKNTSDKVYFYTKWDYCIPCKHVQHYDHFKSSSMKELDEYQEKLDFLKSI